MNTPKSHDVDDQFGTHRASGGILDAWGRWFVYHWYMYPRYDLVGLYGHPTSPSDFEAYYVDSHDPLVDKIPGLKRKEGRAGRVVRSLGCSGTGHGVAL
jgi:hypothetical protein